MFQTRQLILKHSKICLAFYLFDPILKKKTRYLGGFYEKSCIVISINFIVNE